MKYVILFIVLIASTLLVYTSGSAQLVISESDVQAGFFNSVQTESSDTTTALRNLGDGSSGQTWNFSDLNLSSSTLRLDTVSYLPTAGQLGASSFPGAGNCITESAVSPLDGDTLVLIDYVEYLELDANGVYLSGGVEHVHFTPAEPPYLSWPSDTVIYLFYHPKSLAIPLPLSNTGATTTTMDTASAPGLLGNPGKTTVTLRKVTMSGEGTVTVPGGRSFDAIRIVTQQIIATTMSGHTTTDTATQVEFFGQDMSEVAFGVSNSYSSGSTVPASWQIYKKIGSVAGVRKTSSVVPAGFELLQNYPNPFNPTTTIKFDVAKEGPVMLTVYNMLGEQVATLANGRYTPGSYSVNFDASVLASGIYMYRLRVGGYTQTKSMVLVK
jgi:hypothetical protein